MDQSYKHRRLGMGINSDTLTNRPPFSDDTLLYIVLPYKPNIPLIHSILCYKLFANICKFLYLYIIILADIYA